jgi:hypothetical protein
MKHLRENRKQAFTGAIIFNFVHGLICLLIGSLLPVAGGVQESRASSQECFSAYCAQVDRVNARPQNLTLTQSKSQRRQANLALATSSSWAGLIHVSGRVAHISSPRAAYSSFQGPRPSDRAPPSIAA